MLHQNWTPSVGASAQRPWVSERFSASVSGTSKRLNRNRLNLAIMTSLIGSVSDASLPARNPITPCWLLHGYGERSPERCNVREPHIRCGFNTL